MKKLLFLLAVPLLFFACSKDDQGLPMSYQRDFEIAAGLNTFDTWVFPLTNFPTNKVTFLTANGISEQSITRITPREARLSINFSDEDFYFVRAVVVEIFTGSTPPEQQTETGEQQRWKEIYFRENIPLNTGKTIDLIPSLPEVTDILLGEQFTVQVEFLFRDLPPEFIETRLEMVFWAEYE